MHWGILKRHYSEPLDTGGESSPRQCQAYHSVVMRYHQILITKSTREAKCVASEAKTIFKNLIMEETKTLSPFPL